MSENALIVVKFRKKLHSIIFILIFLIIIFFNYYMHDYQNESDIKEIDSKFVLELKGNRLNKLFDILLESETKYEQTLDKLNIVSFKKIINKENSFNNSYLQVKDRKIFATDELKIYLNDLSEYYVFNRPQVNSRKVRIQYFHNKNFKYFISLKKKE